MLPTEAAPIGQTRTCASSGGAIDDGARDGGVVIYRLRVRHAADGGESAASGCARAGFDGFGHFLAGLAQVAVQIDEAGRDDQSVASKISASADAEVRVRRGRRARRRSSTSWRASVLLAGSSTRPFL